MATKTVPGPDGSRVETTRKGSTYLIRPYESGDADGVVSLLATHQFSAIDGTWFQKTYVENPYLDHVPLFVVESDDEIVGIRPFTAFRVRAGQQCELALLTRDTLLHPNHRRRGLFTEMTELALEYYESAEPAFVFSHSNHRSFPGYRKMGWSSLGHRVTYSRVQNAAPLVDVKTRDTVTTLLSPAASLLSRTHRAVRDRLSTSSPEITVTRHETVPADILAALYRQHCPETPHIVRDETFYRWRFQIFEWQPSTTFVARRDGDPVAAITTVADAGKLSTTSVVDVVPRIGCDRWARAIGAALDSAIASHRETDVLRIPEPAVPVRVLKERGFLPGNRLPLSVLASDKPLTLGFRPLGDEVRIDGYPVSEATTELWSVAH